MGQYSEDIEEFKNQVIIANISNDLQAKIEKIEYNKNKDGLIVALPDRLCYMDFMRQLSEQLDRIGIENCFITSSLISLERYSIEDLLNIRGEIDKLIGDRLNC